MHSKQVKSIMFSENIFTVLTQLSALNEKKVNENEFTVKLFK